MQAKNDMQLSLFTCQGIEFINEYLKRTTGKQVLLAVTDNSTSMLSVKPAEGMIHVRLHRMLLNAGIEVLDEIAGFIKKRGGKTPLLRSFIKQNSSCLKKSPPRKFNFKTNGKYYDLRHMFDSLNMDYFEGGISASITWGVKNPRRLVRRRTLGSYSSHTGTIRINPLLDGKTVPRYFIEFIIYHEMLHADTGMGKKNGRNIAHTREFRRRERLFKDYDRAITWEKANI